MKIWKIKYETPWGEGSGQFNGCRPLEEIIKNCQAILEENDGGTAYIYDNDKLVYTVLQPIWN